MQYTIEITITAEEDLIRASLYISTKLMNPDAADRLVSRMEASFQQLSYFPEKFSLVHDSWLRDIGLRMYQVDHYLVFFRIQQARQKVQILRVLYEKQDWKNILLTESTAF